MSEPNGSPKTLFDLKEMELNFGPQHPSTHGVLRLMLELDGETQAFSGEGVCLEGNAGLADLFAHCPHRRR